MPRQKLEHKYASFFMYKIIRIGTISIIHARCTLNKRTRQRRLLAPHISRQFVFYKVYIQGVLWKYTHYRNISRYNNDNKLLFIYLTHGYNNHKYSYLNFQFFVSVKIKKITYLNWRYFIEFFCLCFRFLFSLS